MGYEQQIHEQALALGGEVAAALEPARVFLRRADELNAALDAARKAEEAEYARSVEAAANTGKLPSLNGFGRWMYDSPSSKQVVAAVRLCHMKASAAGVESGQKLFEALQRRVAAVVKESVKLAATLPPYVTDERSAYQAQQHETWQRLGALVDTWDACHDLNRLLGRAQWIPGPAHPKDRPGARTFEAYEVPHRLATIKGPVPVQLHLAAAVKAGAGPSLIDWPTAVARWERLDRRQRPYISMNVTQRHDRLGNVIAEEKSPETASAFVPSPQDA